MAILDVAGQSTNTQSCQDSMGNPNAQPVRVEADTSQSPRLMLFKGMVNGVTTTRSVTYVNGCNDAAFDANFVNVNSAVAHTGVYSGITASHCVVGADGVMVFLDANLHAYAWCQSPKEMAR